MTLPESRRRGVGVGVASRRALHGARRTAGCSGGARRRLAVQVAGEQVFEVFLLARAG